MGKVYDITIIGGGIVGLATAYQILNKNPRTRILLLEKESSLGRHQTGHNSGVIHSGIYYKPNSLKALNCTKGRKELIEFCKAKDIPLKKVGKVIVATQSSDIPFLNELYKRGLANQVEGVKLINKEELLEIEPNCSGLEALHVPDCYSVSFGHVARELGNDIVKKDGEIHLQEKVENVIFEKKEIYIETTKNCFQSSFLINCAGLFSDSIASRILGTSKVPYRILPFRGEYYELKEEKRHLVNGHIYPVPNPKFPFLGVHLTTMVNGVVEAGPNAVLAWSREGYKKGSLSFADSWTMLSYKGFWKMALKYWNVGLYEAARSWNKKLFVRDLQKLVPSIQIDDLIPGNAGVRAQLVKQDGTMVDDFSYVKEENCFHLLNAPSPAATASFSIGRMISEQIN